MSYHTTCLLIPAQPLISKCDLKKSHLSPRALFLLNKKKNQDHVKEPFQLQVQRELSES